MMFLICSKDPKEAVDYLIDNTNKLFCFKQLMELGQLICSCGISSVFKPISRGKEIQAWILENPHYVYNYFLYLLLWCMEHVNLKQETVEKFNRIIRNLRSYINKESLLPANICTIAHNLYPKTIVFRYKKEYAGYTKYKSNEIISIEEGIKEYKEYLKWKMREKALA